MKTYRIGLFGLVFSALLVPAIGSAATLSGVVRDAAGHPLGPPAQVVLGYLDCRFYCFVTEVASTPVAENGAYRLENVPAGYYALYAKAPGKVGAIYPRQLCLQPSFGECIRSPHEDLHVATGTVAISGLDFALPDAARLSGRIVDAETRRPIAGVEVSLSMSDERATATRSAISDSTGRYVFDQLRNISFNLATRAVPQSLALRTAYAGVACTGSDALVCSDPRPQTTYRLAEGEQKHDADILVRKGGKLRVVLRDAVTRREAVGMVSIYNADSNAIVQDIPAWGGSAESGVLEPANYKVVIRRNQVHEYNIETIRYGHVMYANHACGLQACSLDRGDRLAITAGATTDLEFDLQPRFHVAGRVLAPDGSPLPGVAVVAGDPGINNVPFGSTYEPVLYDDDRAVTDADGRFTLSGLKKSAVVRTEAAGAYTDAAFPGLPCSARNLFCTDAAMAIDLASFEGRRADLGEVKLSSPAAIDGTVKSSSGAPVAGAHVYLLNPVTWQRAKRVATDSEGRYTLSGLPADSYLIAAQTDSAKTEIYKGIACARTFSAFVAQGCHDNAHRPVATAPGQVVTGINFEGAHRFFGSDFETRPSAPP